MNMVDTQKIDCPYCGEYIELVVDCSVPDQSYVEDCQVCCRPIALRITCDESGDISIVANTENDGY